MPCGRPFFLIRGEAARARRIVVTSPSPPLLGGALASATDRGPLTGTGQGRGAMTQLTRRGALTVGALSLASVGTLAACAPLAPKPSPSPTPAGPPQWSELSAAVTGTVALPGSAEYDTVKLVENPRWDAAMPLAVLSAAT